MFNIYGRRGSEDVQHLQGHVFFVGGDKNLGGSEIFFTKNSSKLQKIPLRGMEGV